LSLDQSSKLFGEGDRFRPIHVTKKEAGIGISYFEIRMIRKIKPLFFA